MFVYGRNGGCGRALCLRSGCGLAGDLGAGPADRQAGELRQFGGGGFCLSFGLAVGNCLAAIQSFAPSVDGPEFGFLVGENLEGVSRLFRIVFASADEEERELRPIGREAVGAVVEQAVALGFDLLTFGVGEFFAGERSD